MIIRSEFRQVGGLAAHLGRLDTNREVEIKQAFVRDCPLAIEEALGLFAVLSATNARCRRDFVHFKISPRGATDDLALGQILAVIEAEHNIPATTPRHVTRHAKGERADHFHVIYALVDPMTGKALSSSNNYLKDEIGSRRLEVMFGEPLTSGPRDRQVVEELRRRGLVAEAAAVAGATRQTRERGIRLGDSNRRQAARLEMTDSGLQRFVTKVWAAYKEPGDMQAALARRGLALAQGDKTVMVFDVVTTFARPLHRTINMAAKAAGSEVRVRTADLFATYPDLQRLSERKPQLLQRVVETVERELVQELGAWRREAELDDDKAEATEAATREKEKSKERAARATEFRQTLAERRRRIREANEQRRKLRRRRVDRAFKIAAITGNKTFRRAAFLAIASGLLLAGGGLGFALVMAGVARSALPTREQARAIAYEARLQNDADFIAMRSKLDAAYGDIRAELTAKSAKPLAAKDKPIDLKELERVRQRLLRSRERGWGR